MKKNFTKSDLKDGMVVTYRNGNERTIMGFRLYTKNENFEYICMTCLEHFKADLTVYNSSEKNDSDIMKVSYMGEVLWERKEYVSFDVARKSGKRIRYCGELRGGSWIHSMYAFLDILDFLSSWDDTNEVNKVLDDPMWEIEE